MGDVSTVDRNQRLLGETKEMNPLEQEGRKEHMRTRFLSGGFLFFLDLSCLLRLFSGQETVCEERPEKCGMWWKELQT